MESKTLPEGRPIRQRVISYLRTRPDGAYITDVLRGVNEDGEGEVTRRQITHTCCTLVKHKKCVRITRGFGVSDFTGEKDACRFFLLELGTPPRLPPYKDPPGVTRLGPDWGWLPGRGPVIADKRDV